MVKKILGYGILAIATVLILAAAVVFYIFYSDTQNPYLGRSDYVGVNENTIPKFKEVNIGFTHKFDDAKDLPLMASALIDFDNDGIDEVFIGGGTGQSDALFKFENGEFRDISEQTGLKSMKKTYSLGAVSFDLDEDGKTDLIIARTDGVYFLKNDGEAFADQRLGISTNEKSNPASLTLGDYDKDGDADIFLCNYITKDKMDGLTIFKDDSYGSNSLLLRNDGDLKFSDVTDEVNLTYTHNTFQAVFVDVDEDSWLDLVVAYDTGQPKIYRNDKGKSFTEMETPMTNKYGYPMGIAVGDFNNDGRVDFFFSNTGTSVFEFLARGDLEPEDTFVATWMLFKNEGDFKFTDVANETQVADFEFSWGAIFEDFNLDGKQDLVVAENFISFPPHSFLPLPGRFLIQGENENFAAVEGESGVVNKNFGITPLASDFNNDGYPDLVFANLGGSFRAFINQGGKNQFVKIRFPEESKFVGAKAVLETKNGEVLSDVYVLGEGLASDNTSVLTFGLKKDDEPKSLTISYSNGEKETIVNPTAGKVYKAGERLEKDAKAETEKSGDTK